MMVKPPLKKLESQVDSKYTLVTLAAKRARELTDGEPCLAESTHATDKPVSLAVPLFSRVIASSRFCITS